MTTTRTTTPARKLNNTPATLLPADLADDDARPFQIQVLLWTGGANQPFAKVSGHLALRLKGPGLKGDGDKDYACFINWAPARGTDKCSGLAVSGRIEKGRFAYQADKRSMGTRDAQTGQIHSASPNLKALIPAREQTGLAGLDALAIYDWWRVFSRADASLWTLANYNCSSVVAKALIAGGARDYADPPRFPVWTPHIVYTWAVDVAKRIEAVNARFVGKVSARRLGELRAEARLGHRPPEASAPPWTVEVFKKKSDAGLLAHRYDAMKKIDKALEAFHATAASADHGVSLCNRKFAALLVLEAIHDQMAARPDSARREAVLTLGLQMLGEIDRIDTLREVLRAKPLS